jgi:N-acetylneuraminic acid mutarotase
MPQMSVTEKEAIDAGTTWFDADLFRGDPDWEKLHNYPRPRLIAEEKAFIDGKLRRSLHQNERTNRRFEQTRNATTNNNKRTPPPHKANEQDGERSSN